MGKLKLNSLEEAKKELDKVLNSDTLETPHWSIYKIMAHCAQTILISSLWQDKSRSLIGTLRLLGNKKTALDNFAAIYLLKQQKLKLTKEVNQVFTDCIAIIGEGKLEERIEQVRSKKFKINVDPLK